MTDRYNRRKFIRQSALGGLVLASPLGQFSLPPKKTGMKMGLVTYLWGKDWSVPDIIANCTAAGIYGVELRTEHAHGVQPTIDMASRKKVKQMFDDSKVEFLGPGTNQDYHHKDQAKLRASIEETKAFIKLSHDVGGTGVKVKPNTLPKGVSKQKTIEQIGRSLNEVGKYAADYGQEIRVEVHGRETQELPVMKAIMDIADHPAVKVCWNCNMNDLNGEGLEYNFNLVKDRFGKTVHIRELNVGSYPYQELVNLFVKMDYEGWILLECRTSPEDRVKAMIEQRKLWRKMEKKSKKLL